MKNFKITSILICFILAYCQPLFAENCTNLSIENCPEVTSTIDIEEAYLNTSFAAANQLSYVIVSGDGRGGAIITFNSTKASSGGILISERYTGRWVYFRSPLSVKKGKNTIRTNDISSQTSLNQRVYVAHVSVGGQTIKKTFSLR